MHMHFLRSLSKQRAQVKILFYTNEDFGAFWLAMNGKAAQLRLSHKTA